MVSFLFYVFFYCTLFFTLFLTFMISIFHRCFVCVSVLFNLRFMFLFFLCISYLWMLFFLSVYPIHYHTYFIFALCKFHFCLIHVSSLFDLTSIFLSLLTIFHSLHVSPFFYILLLLCIGLISCHVVHLNFTNITSIFYPCFIYASPLFHWYFTRRLSYLVSPQWARPFLKI